MKIVMIIVRTLMGLMFLFSSVPILFNLVPMPELPPGPLKEFNEGLAASGYFFTLLKVTELLCGIALLTGRFVPLALVILAPIILNIVMVHTFLDRTMPGPVIAYLLLAGGLFLAYYYRDAYRPLLKP
jgi:uncharacterized membrane protein YphA (DoxX/SURF4 family)